MVDWYTLKQIGALQVQTNHRAHRVLIGDKVVMQPTNDNHAVLALMDDWQAMTDSESLRFSTMNALANRLNIQYEDIYRPFYQHLASQKEK
jgi:hypothetical protein